MRRFRSFGIWYLAITLVWWVGRFLLTGHVARSLGDALAVALLTFIPIALIGNALVSTAAFYLRAKR